MFHEDRWKRETTRHQVPAISGSRSRSGNRLRGIAGSGTFLNHAVWESTAHYRAARLNDTARSAARALYPDSLVVRPHLLRPQAVAGICVA